MTDSPLNVLVVCGSNSASSSTKVALAEIAGQLQQAGCAVDVLDLHDTQLPILNPESSWGADYYGPLKARVAKADAFVLGTPDYHGSISGAIKNFLDHFWKEFAGKLFATVVASHEKGLTVHDQLRTIARQCYAWTMPYGLSLDEKADLKDGRIAGEVFAQRLTMLVRDLQVYGRLLAGQRAADLAGTEPGFLARHRK
ncbi:MAG TPA: NADPH-dependent FMN reductase [Verrucomicrobiales bacterium]|nr:NADPH-dependent FMN reductase [Verrucomicrobiales bacterium]